MLNDNARRAKYLTSLNQTLYLRDIVERNRIVNIHEFAELMKVMASGIGLSKYYFQATGLRNALLGFRQVEETHIMENIIYNELRSRGYSVDVGMVEARTATERKQLEVDFVENKGNKRYYIQSAFALPSDEKREQELASFKRINDSFKKILISREDIAPYTMTTG